MNRERSSNFARQLEEALDPDEVNRLGFETKFSQRLRIVTPIRLVLSLVAALGSFGVESIASLLRTFNFQYGTTTAYKPFYNRLARAGFPDLMLAVLSQLLEKLAVQTLALVPTGPLSRLRDIIIQDGSSFAVKKTLASVYPGRFNTVEPAAVEIHMTYSARHDEALSISLTPDSFSERAELPSVEDLKGCLLLGDRGYPSAELFAEIDDAGGFFLMRVTKSWRPRVHSFVCGGKEHTFKKPVPLQDVLSQNQGQTLDLVVSFAKHKHKRLFRIVAVHNTSKRKVKKPSKKDQWVRLCTNLPSDFSPRLVGQLYRFRWQVELVFKEWKSYANLHKFNTGNRHIAEGLIWASLCTAVIKRFLAHAAQHLVEKPVSTRRVAMCARHFLATLMRALLFTHRATFRRIWNDAVRYIRINGLRAHPERDRLSGRLQAGLVEVISP